MSAEKTFYTVIAVIVVVAGIGIGAAYYDSVSSIHSSSSQVVSSSLTLIVTPNNWYHNSTINHRQPAYYVLEPNGTLASSAIINLPAHQLISLTIIDYDSGFSPLLGNVTINGTVQNNSYFAKVVGTVGGVEYIYNGTPEAVNGTLSSNVSNGMQVNHGAGWAVSALPWVGNASGGWEVTHTFTVLNGANIMVNIPTWAGSNPSGGTVTHATFYINQTGTYAWQCFAPCGTGIGWGGAMATAGWMMGTIQVS